MFGFIYFLDFICIFILSQIDFANPSPGLHVNHHDIYLFGNSFAANYVMSPRLVILATL